MLKCSCYKQTTFCLWQLPPCLGISSFLKYRCAINCTSKGEESVLQSTGTWIMGSCLCSEELCILESSCSKQFVGYLHSRSVAKTKYFLWWFNNDQLSFSWLPKEKWKNGTYDSMTSAAPREMFTCLGNLDFVTKCSTVLQITSRWRWAFFSLFSVTQHPFSINLGEFINVLQCDFVRGASHMFHCGDAATSQSLWFTFEDTNRISLRMWQKPGSELLWM